MIYENPAPYILYYALQLPLVILSLIHILLDIIMDEETRSDFERDPSLVIGASRNERYAGTNAIGTCLYEKKPMVFWGEEHYNLVHKRYTCSGAPVVDAEGNVIGAVSITGKKESYNEHTLAIVISICAAIEEDLRQSSSCLLYTSFLPPTVVSSTTSHLNSEPMMLSWLKLSPTFSLPSSKSKAALADVPVPHGERSTTLGSATTQFWMSASSPFGGPANST